MLGPEVCDSFPIVFLRSLTAQMKRLFVLGLVAGSVLMAADQPAATDLPSIAAKAATFAKIDGFVPLYWDEKGGKIWMEINRWNREFLYVNSLPAGVGSNDIGLDRGLMREPRVVQFERTGPRVLLIESNYGFRAVSENPLERRAAEQAFARSAVWGFDVAAQDGPAVLVDATSFFLRDAAGAAQQLSMAKQGSYHVDPMRCAFYLPMTKGFPKNTEVEMTITLAGEPAGPYVTEVVPTPDSITVREHQSLIELPDGNYQPRALDPRAGFFGINYMDFAAPIDQPVMKRFIARHRLEKKDPMAAVSEPVKPIVYYVDPGAPKDIQQALIEGASWWNEAFEAAGFRNAFQVKVLPPDADPMDIRYNIIQWVHRSTRGWSYGAGLADPRTGEIIKGVVSLGSLREHQDYLIFESLLAPHAAGPHSHEVLKQAVYARLRQLSAHEVGHTLGLEHNYIASSHNRASVMDYPHPLLKLTAAGTVDLSDAYAKGIGQWDKVAITYGYSQFPPGTDEHSALNKIIVDAAATGDTFITDADSRPFGSAHPKSHLWDNGAEAVDELNSLLKIRAAALSRFGENNIETGAPLSTLDEVLVPLYFLHRYQTEAVSKVLGGNEYTYALRGDGQPITKIVPAAEQRRALEALLETIKPETLTLPDRILVLIPPRPPDYPRTRETFPYRTGVTFDPLAGAEVSANLTVGLILNPERAARLVQYHAQSPDNPGLDEVITKLLAATWGASTPAGLGSEVARSTRFVVVQQLMALASDSSAPAQVRAIATSHLEDVKRQAAILARSDDAETKAQGGYTLLMLEKFGRDPKSMDVPHPIGAPPGQPIGDDEGWVPWLPSATDRSGQLQ
jgi:hypothetical protein